MKALVDRTTDLSLDRSRKRARQAESVLARDRVNDLIDFGLIRVAGTNESGVNIDFRGKGLTEVFADVSMPFGEFLSPLALETLEPAKVCSFERYLGRWILHRLIQQEPFTDQHFWRSHLDAGIGIAGLFRVNALFSLVKSRGVMDTNLNLWTVDRVYIPVPSRKGKHGNKMSLVCLYRDTADKQRLIDIVSNTITNDPTARSPMPRLQRKPTETEAATAATDVGKQAPSDDAPSESPSISGPLKKDTIL